MDAGSIPAGSTKKEESAKMALSSFLLESRLNPSRAALCGNAVGGTYRRAVYCVCVGIGVHKFCANGLLQTDRTLANSRRFHQQKPNICLPTNVRFLFIQAAGLAYHRRTKCGAYHQGRKTALVSHHAPACISLRLDDIQHFVLMIYRNKLRVIYKAAP